VSDKEVESILSGLTDELLLANEISYVNGIWDKVSNQRNARKTDSGQLSDNLEQLKAF